MPHVASASDFLLVRLPGGNIALRELTGCVTVGQQHPSVLIWAPFSAEALAYEKARFKVNHTAQATPHTFCMTIFTPCMSHINVNSSREGETKGVWSEHIEIGTWLAGDWSWLLLIPN